MRCDFNMYEDVNDMVGYVGFITPDGKYMRVRKYGQENTCIHPIWCQEYLKRFNIYLSMQDAWNYCLNTLKFMLLTEAKGTIKNIGGSLEGIQNQKYLELKRTYERLA